MMEKITHRGHFGNLEEDSKESLALLFARFTNPWIIIIIIIIILIIITIIIIIISSIIVIILIYYYFIKSSGGMSLASECGAF